MGKEGPTFKERMIHNFSDFKTLPLGSFEQNMGCLCKEYSNQNMPLFKMLNKMYIFFSVFLIKIHR